jgi:uncharacterized ferritin-like protein (DUF455 family)
MTLFDRALCCLLLADPAAKVEATFAVAQEFAARRGEPGFLDPACAAPPRPLPVPGRPERPRLVAPRELPQRKLTSAPGRAALVHAVAHIEFNAINLAWDAVYRFRGLPADYYADWVGVAADEARHFTLLRERLAELGHAYGDCDAHNGLWDMAVKTADDCLARMALVPRVLEARGLDVTPGMIERLRAAGDDATAAILAVILREEVAHVAAGSRWFRWCCERAGREPTATFRALVAAVAPGAVRPPFNFEARARAGFLDAELAGLAEASA